MNQLRPYFLLVLIVTWTSITAVQAQSITVSGSCFTNPIVLTENPDGTAYYGRRYYEGVGTVSGRPNITISIAWINSLTSWFVRISGGAHFQYAGDTPLPPNNNYNNWVKLVASGNLESCPYGSTINITGNGTQQDPLPVTLAAFYSQTKTDRVILNWTTTDEQDNAGFEIMRSSDAYSWTSIAYVDGKGNSSTLQEYTLEDRQPTAGLNYYRLKQLDHDGTGTDSRIIAVSFEPSRKLSSFPNPTYNQLTINLPRGESIKHIQILSKLGQRLRSFEGSDNKIHLADLPSGQYLLEVTTHSGVQMVESFVKL